MKFNFKIITLFLMFIIYQLDARPAFADPGLEATQMLQFFSASCPSQGQWTQYALNSANNLVQTLKTLESDPDCKTLSGVVPQIQNLSNQITFMIQDPNQRQILSLEAQQQSLLLMIRQTTDPTQLATLAPELQIVNVQLAQYQGLKHADDQFTQQQIKGNALQSLVSGTNAILQQASQNATCLSNHQSILPALAGLSGSIGAIALTGGTSLIVAAGVDIFNTVISNARTRKIAKTINRMASAMTASALQCVLESLSNQWCTSNDALGIIKLKGHAFTSQTLSPIEQGIHLLDRDYIIFLNWLQTVQSGTAPVNEAMAARQIAVLESERYVKAAQKSALGYIGQKTDLFNSVKTPEEQWNIELSIIDQILKAFTTVACGSFPCPNSPLAEIFSNAGTVGPWFLIGIDDSKIPREPTLNSSIPGNRRQLANFSLSDLRSSTEAGVPNFKPDLNVLTLNMTDWWSRARARVSSESSKTSYLDPLKLITDSATTNLTDDHSPYKSLLKIIAFLDTSKPTLGAATGSFQNIYSDTSTRLRNIKEKIERVLASPSMTAPEATQIVTEIFAEAVLDNGTGFIGDRLQWALKLSINNLILDDHSGLSPSESASLLATNNIITQLESYSPGPTLDNSKLNSIANDIKKSQGILQNSLNVFTEQFGDAIETAIKNFETQARLLNEDQDGNNNQQISELCLELLAAPIWPSAVNQKHCIGRSLTSIFDTGPSSSQVTETLIHASYPKRVCEYRDYNRKNQLFQFFHSNH